MTAPFGCWKEATSMPCGPDVTALAVGVIPSARFWSSCGLCVMAAFEPRPGGLDETVADGAAPCCERATSPVATEPAPGFCGSRGLRVMAAFEPWPGGFDETVADGAGPCCEPDTSPVATEPAPGFCGSRGLRVMAAFEPWPGGFDETVADGARSEEHTSELQSQ